MSLSLSLCLSLSLSLSLSFCLSLPVSLSLSLCVLLSILEKRRWKERELEIERKGLRVRGNREKMGATITLNGHTKVGNI